MTKLTNWTRDRIAGELVTRAFAERKDKHKKAGTALADRILKDVLGDKYKLLATIRSGWLPMATHVDVRVGDTGWNRIECDETPIPNSQKGGCLAVYDAGSSLGEAVMSYCSEARAIGVDRQKMFAEIKAVLYSCGTVNKLLETWPEVRPFLNIPAPAKPLPMVRIDVLNGKIGLPIEDRGEVGRHAAAG